jgi:threonine aldolase
MVCASKDVIAEAHRLRKRLGGGMRQAGVLAAAARIALEDGRERLVEDHANARLLAEGLNELNEGAVDLEAVQTNMVYLDLTRFDIKGPRLAALLTDEGVLTLGMAPDSMRLVTHRDVSEMDIRTALEAFKKVLLG